MANQFQALALRWPAQLGSRASSDDVADIDRNNNRTHRRSVQPSAFFIGTLHSKSLAFPGKFRIVVHRIVKRGDELAHSFFAPKTS
jgi:hypothetical protein